MPESVISFQSLPPDYQRVIQLAQERHNISITPLQELAGGWSGAIIYLVSVANLDDGKVSHLILKLDRKRPHSTSDEVSRHQFVLQSSPAEFAANHIPEIIFERVEAGDALAIFYTIAGQSLHNFRTLSKHRRQSRLQSLFSITNRYLLVEWNRDLTFEHVAHPQDLLGRWLGFRLDPGQKIEGFLLTVCQVPIDVAGFIIKNNIFPNPLFFARNPEPWGAIRPSDAVIGLQHSDLNTNNILAKFSRKSDEIEGYYLIDFALFKEEMPLLFDLRYLEMSFLVHALFQGSVGGVIDLISQLGMHEILEPEHAPMEMAGVNSVIRAGRLAFADWVTENYPSLHDDLWGQYWLAGTAAGLSYCHKSGLADDVRLAGLIFAAANLRQYFKLNDLPVPAEAVQLDGEVILGSTVTRESVATTRRKPDSLPVPPTNFVGRQTEVDEIRELLLGPQVRLVTLTGPGGTGKTRLGLEVGRAMQSQFSQGVFFVDLSAIRDPDLVATTTAHALGVRQGGGRPPLDNLKNYLVDKQMLLIMDNFEHVTRAAPVVAELLAISPGIKILVTSRIPLSLRGEQEYPVSTLGTPTDLKLSVEEALRFEAIDLFWQQARRVRPRFQINEENLAPVIEICRRLDGLPLAIEIAAARIRMLTPSALSKRLNQSLKLLVGGALDLPDRQQTMRRTIDWSYELLDPTEQRLLSSLGVFAGGFTLEAAEAVCDPFGEIDVFSGIETLVNNSLLRQVKSVGDEPRFDMLQTIHDYAIEKASEADLLDDLRQVHCEYFAGLAGGEMGQGVFGAQSVMWLRRFEEEHDNYRVALTWAFEHQEGLLAAVAMLNPLGWFWYRFGHLQEGSEWTERAIEVAATFGDSPLLAAALAGRSYLALWSGDLIVGAQRARASLEMAQRLKMDEIISMAKLSYGTILVNQGKDREAYPHLVDAVELYDQQNQPWLVGTTLVHLANVSLGLGNPGRAVHWLDMAMPQMIESGDPWCIAFCLNNYGEVARAQGNYTKAEEYYRRTEELYSQADARGDQVRLVHTFGYIAKHKGELEQAEALFRESLGEFRELGNHRGIAECLAGLAGVAVERGQFEWATPLLGSAESQLKAFGGAWWPADRVEIDEAKKRLATALPGQYESLWTRGQKMDANQAVSYAMSVDSVP